MSLRDYIRRLDERGELIHVTAPISKTHEIAGVLKQLEPAPVLFENVRESAFPRDRATCSAARPPLPTTSASRSTRSSPS